MNHQAQTKSKEEDERKLQKMLEKYQMEMNMQRANSRKDIHNSSGREQKLCLGRRYGVFQRHRLVIHSHASLPVDHARPSQLCTFYINEMRNEEMSLHFKACYIIILTLGRERELFWKWVPYEKF